MIYLDYAATSPIDPEVLEVFQSELKDSFANPSSAHKLGKTLSKRVDQARESISLSLGGTKNDRVVFTSSATEANNMAIRGLGLASDDMVLCHGGEHPSVVKPCALFDVKHFDYENLEEVSRAKLLVMSLVNNQTGQIQAVKEVSAKVKELNPSIHIHLDAVQGIGKVPFSLKDCSIDSMSLACHKFYGPKGVGALWLKSGAAISPLLVGGSQEAGLRSSTVNAPGIFALEKALTLATEFTDERYQQVLKVRSRVKENLERIFNGISFPFEENVSPYILCILIPKVSSDIIMRHLEEKGIYISSTSACSSKVKGFNPTLSALGIEEKFHKNILRLSFSHLTTDSEIEETIKSFEQLVEDMGFLFQ